jgi:hypothetical protein
VTSALIAGALLAAVALRLAFLVRRGRDKAWRAHAADTAGIATVIDNVAEVPNGTAGVATWVGSWNGSRVQIRTIVDTLAIRKLPARWLSVTVTEKVAVSATFDMMMRPGSPTTFSNFDLLPHTLPTFAGFPADAVVRTNRTNALPPNAIIAGHLDIFSNRPAKELLISPNGIRIVWLLAEADRARYGVFRQADFNRSTLDPRLVDGLLRSACAIREAINGGQRQAA